VIAFSQVTSASLSLASVVEALPFCGFFLLGGLRSGSATPLPAAFASEILGTLLARDDGARYPQQGVEKRDNMVGERKRFADPKSLSVM